MNHKTEVAIIGSGPYGLSLAAHLSKRVIPYLIFGMPMHFWRTEMPNGMYLKSDGFASNLYDPDSLYTLKQFCEQEGVKYDDTSIPVNIDTFVRYGISFQKRFVPDLQKNNVVHLTQTPNGFTLALDNDETVAARCVVVATGISSFRHVPRSLGHLPREFLTHSSQHNDLGSFRNRDVIVIGAGASATDLAALLYDGGANVQIVARSQSICFHSGGNIKPRSLWQTIRHPSSGIGPGWRTRVYSDAPGLFHLLPETLRLYIVQKTLGPAGGWFMKDKILGHVPRILGFSPTGAEVHNGKVLVKLRGVDGSDRELVTEHIIAATGYKTDIRRLEFLSAEIKSQIAMVDNTPILSSKMLSSVPGLYFAGAVTANSFGPVMRFAFGARFAAPHLARALAKALSSGRD